MKTLATLLTLLYFVAPSAAQNVDLGTDAQREAGRLMYNAKCSHCHGARGAGDGAATAFLRPAPRDFTTGTFKFRTTENGELPTDEDIRRSIRQGMPYTGMPPWPQLSEQEVDNLMYYIKTFSDFFSGPFAEVTALDMPSPPSITDESIVRGREVFLENSCIDCHGNLGRGDGPSGPTLTDQWDIPIRAADLTKRWTFRGGSTRSDIYRTFTTGLDGSPMPAFDIQPIEDQWALVNYVHSLSRDEADYSTYATSVFTTAAIDPSAGADAFSAAPEAFFAMVGQVIEPGRSFFPGVNGLAVRAMHNADHIGIMLQWNDMSADTDGINGPGLEVPIWPNDTDTTQAFSDAVAIQFPSGDGSGGGLPYLLFGDVSNSVDLWFADLSTPRADHYVGNGSGNLTASGMDYETSASYEDGQWTVIIKRDRTLDGQITFEDAAFAPVLFSVWDGFSRERGNRRGLTSWTYLYLEPAETESPLGPMAMYGLITLLLGLGATTLIRRKYSNVSA